MTKRELLLRIEALERRVRELEMRPPVMAPVTSPGPVFVPYRWQDPQFVPPFTITCETTGAAPLPS